MVRGLAKWLLLKAFQNFTINRIGRESQSFLSDEYQIQNLIGTYLFQVLKAKYY